MNKEQLQAFKEKLEKTKEDIQKELETIAKKDDSPKGDWETKYPNRENGSMEEEADEVQEYDNLLPVEHTLEVRLKDVTLALEKIERGHYGICEKCSKPIESERLMAFPEGKFCKKCNN